MKLLWNGFFSCLGSTLTFQLDNCSVESKEAARSKLQRLRLQKHSFVVLVAPDVGLLHVSCGII